MKLDVKKNGAKYYLYILVFVDDLHIISENSKTYMDIVAYIFRIKEDIIMHLGATISKCSLDSDEDCWVVNLSKYFKKAIRAVKRKMGEDGMVFTSKATQSFRSIS